MDDENMEKYQMSSIWTKLEESWNPTVQSVDPNQEQIREEDHETHHYSQDHAELNKLFPNVGKSAQSSEFGGADVWLLKGDYPIQPGTTATLLYCDSDTYHGADSYNIFTRSLPDANSGEYVDSEDPIVQGSLKEVLPVAKQIKAGHDL
jgi:hypothetical protein